MRRVARFTFHLLLCFESVVCLPSCKSFTCSCGKSLLENCHLFYLKTYLSRSYGWQRESIYEFVAFEKHQVQLSKIVIYSRMLNVQPEFNKYNVVSGRLLVLLYKNLNDISINVYFSLLASIKLKRYRH